MSDANQRFFDLLESDQSDPQIQYELGQCYLTGDGVEQNGAEAEKWLRRAADQGHEGAAALLAGPAGGKAAAQEPLDADTLPDWCLRAEEGDVEAQYQVACYFLEHGTKIDQEDAARYLTMAARQGHPRACLLLAKQQLDQGKLDEVAELLRNAADCGLWEAAELLGECYSQGIGMAQNPQEAERRFIQAAEWGGGEQMLRLALRYAKGDQVPASRGRAFSWVKKAQETGVSDAKEQFDLQYAQYMEERRRLAQENAERQAQEEAERQRLAQEEAERIAQEEAERQRLAQEEAERMAQEEAERQRMAQEEAQRQLQAQEEAQRQAQEQARHQTEIQAKQMGAVQSAAFWMGALLLVYVGICSLYQLLDVFSIPVPRFLWHILEEFAFEGQGKQELLYGGLPGLCCAGGYVLSRSGRYPTYTKTVTGVLLILQAVYLLAEILNSSDILFEFIVLSLYGLVVYLISSVIAFYLLLSLSVFVLNVLLGGKLSWPVYDKMNRAIKRRLGLGG